MTTRIALIIGSTRPGRRSGHVADWVLEAGAKHLVGRDVALEPVDVADYGLPLLDERFPAAFGLPYEHEHTRRWAAAIEPYDGLVFVLPEYNRGIPAALKNALDLLYAEWEDKAAGFVSFGGSGGTRSSEQLRAVLGELKVAVVRSQVELGSFTDFTVDDPGNPEDNGRLTPRDHQPEALGRMLDEVVAWADALSPLRAGRARVGTS